MKKKKKGDTPKNAEETPQKSKKKLIILLILIALILIAAGTAVFFLLIKQKDTLPNYYFSQKEGIPSITNLVGERSLTEIAKAKEGDAVTYTYTGVSETSQSDIDEYVTFLTNEKGFEDIELPKDESEEETQSENSAESADDDAANKKEDAKKEKEPSEEEEDASKDDTHFELGADSAAEDTLLVITIEREKDSYKIITHSEKGSLQEALKKVEEKQAEIEEKKKKEEEKNVFKRSDAVSILESCTAEELGIPAAPSEYTLIPSNGIETMEDGSIYFQIYVYEQREGTANYFVGLFLVNCDGGKNIYRCDTLEDTYTLVKGVE